MKEFLLAVVVIILIAVIGLLAVYFLESDNGIKDVRVTNLTSTSATISWETDTGLRSLTTDPGSITTYAIAENLQTPNPFYGNVTNFMVDEPAPSEGIYYYRLIDQTEAPITSWYSTTLTPVATYSGDLSFLRNDSQQLIQFDPQTHRLDTEIKTDVGYGWQVFDLVDRKPLEDAVVNIRYISDQINEE